MTPNANRNHTRGRLNKDEFDKDDVGPTRMNHRADYDYHCHSPVRYRVIARMLAAGVGKPWKTTHQKLSEKFDRRTEVGQFTWDYINQEVDDNAFVDGDGVYLSQPARRWGRRETLFVHPQTGILHRIKTQPYPHAKPVNKDELKLDDLNILRREEGIWYVYIYHMVKRGHERRVTRYAHEHHDGCPATGFDYPAPNYTMSKRTPTCTCKTLYETYYTDEKEQQDKQQLNSKELKAFGLSNTPKAAKMSRREKRRKAA